ncbi:hypothetical protein [Hymenobacter sp. BT491]|uniref:hypothetical protein n=1 Tax=Hymenobacter sp. BT491 TaxID=2766779 RepID=UPI001653CCD4|nr:hypothetical protein [Hymenobacter sp. BT491]MBC6991872.1 hypothetical protein [Hymenobacter sp. BT491]
MNKNLLFSALAVAALALNACSAEPSDWRPENKVSVDLVAPGTRSSDNFDQHTEAAPNQAKGGAIAEPISSHATLEKQALPTADQARTANEQEASKNAKPSQEDTTASGHEVQR